MGFYKESNSTINLSLSSQKDADFLVILGEALASPIRIKILKALQVEPFIFTVPQLVKLLKIPTTTLIHHLEKLEKADLIIRYKGSTQGTTRIISRGKQSANIQFLTNYYKENNKLLEHSQAIKVGLYADFIGEILNFATEDKIEDSINPFAENRTNAQLLFTSNGIITYYINNAIAKTKDIKKLSISLELCSEAPYYNNDFLSEITFWINQKEICTYLSEGDYGDRRGNLNPVWWPNKNTQYGKLLNLVIDQNGCFLNDKKINEKITLSSLMIEKDNKIVFSFGNKPTAKYIGGFNLFGKSFGDYAQDIIVKMYYNS